MKEVPKKKTPRRGESCLFGKPLSGTHFLFFPFHLIDQRVHGLVKTLFKGFAGMFYEKFMPGNRHANFDNLVLDLVDDVVELEVYVHFGDAVVKLPYFRDFSADVIP